MRSIRPFSLALVMTAVASAAVPTCASAHTTDAVVPALQVRTYATGADGRQARAAAEQVARRLLVTAGLAIAWRHCDRAEDCPPDDRAAGSVTLILSSAPQRTCGLTALEPGGRSATVLVSVPCVADVVAALQRQPETRWNPVLARVEPSELLGAAMAHELGHVLGLKHAPSGLMRGRLEPDEILALARGALTFSRAEASRMRASALWPEQALARTR
jgi:hypothetical protein